jgi:surfactin synthase thioesterase subunit
MCRIFLVRVRVLFCCLSRPFTLVTLFGGSMGGRLTCTVVVAIRTACSVLDVVYLWGDVALVL